MKSIAISEFKAHALKMVGDVAEFHEPIILTKRGRPIARVIPFVAEDGVNIPGQFEHMRIYEGDIVSPLGDEDWDACQ